jgi:mono/diheme cytochrome c family protein
MCHGLNGEGRIGATLAKDWPSIRPDLAIKATIERGIQGSPMPAWGQANGGPLSDEEINNLVAYILTWSTPSNPPTLVPTSASTGPGQATGWQLWVLIAIIVAIVFLIGFYLFRRNKT